jgi:hypothetical protein
MNNNQLVTFYTSSFNTFRLMAEDAIKQCPDDKLHESLSPDTNSIAVIMQHISGNLVSRFTNYLTEDGEKPNRDRDGEFVDNGLGRLGLMDMWRSAWELAIRTINDLMYYADWPDLMVTVRGKTKPILLNLNMQLGHMAYHCGQIVQVARVHAGDKWETITIPKGGSEQYNKDHWGK